MKVFIRWSGDESRHVAEALRTWLPTVLAGAVECFVSSQDIRRGDRGMDVIAGELQDRDFGIVVLTKDNMGSPWINFEAGALGKSLGVGKVAPLLLGITRADVEGPISQFQNTLLSDREDMRRFVRDIAALSPGVPQESVDTLFGAKWAELEAVIEQAPGMDNPKTTRSTDSMLEEVLEHVRALLKPGRITFTELEENLRLERLDLLDKRHGGRVYKNGNGAFVDALDYDPRGDRVLVVLDADGVRDWVHASDVSLAPF
ncbi:MAG TPA: hypothetical protein VFE45_00540 [Coriobacteriia bacterium]|nr:hypothetical protein [Coriobacteriia bacterium]